MTDAEVAAAHIHGTKGDKEEADLKESTEIVQAFSKQAQSVKTLHVGAL